MAPSASRRGHPCLVCSALLAALVAPRLHGETLNPEHACAGLTLQDVRLTSKPRRVGKGGGGGRGRRSAGAEAQRGGLLFSHRGFTGPAVLDLSHHTVAALERGTLPPGDCSGLLRPPTDLNQPCALAASSHCCGFRSARSAAGSSPTCGSAGAAHCWRLWTDRRGHQVHQLPLQKVFSSMMSVSWCAAAVVASWTGASEEAWTAALESAGGLSAATGALQWRSSHRKRPSTLHPACGGTFARQK